MTYTMATNNITPDPDHDPRLYIIMRNDMDSLTPGKAMAQAAHAANQFIQQYLSGKPDEEIEIWRKQANGFGTTIVLSGDISDIESLNNELVRETDWRGMVVDPTYPIRDGQVTHHINIVTCFYVFDDGLTKDISDIVSCLGLY